MSQIIDRFRPAVASPSVDTVPLKRVFWDLSGVQRAFASEGIRARVLRDDLAYAGMSNGVALGAGPAEVHLFFYGDVAAADAAMRRLDRAKVQRMQAGSMAGLEVVINNNVLVLLYADGAGKIGQRIRKALGPEPEELSPDDAEP